MSTKELVQTELETLNDEQLDKLYRLIQNLKRSDEQAQPSLMETLMDIKIDAPEDFSTNHDLYLNGEKDVESGLH